IPAAIHRRSAPDASSRWRPGAARWRNGSARCRDRLRKPLGSGCTISAHRSGALIPSPGSQVIEIVWGCRWQRVCYWCVSRTVEIVETEMTSTPQHDLCRSLAQAYRALADLAARPALAEESRRQILATLLTLEREMEAWSTLPQPEYELDLESADDFDYDDEPTHPGI